MRALLITGLWLFCLPHPALGEAPATYLRDIRYFTYPDYTRIVLDISTLQKIAEKQLPGKGNTRLYFDLEACRFSTVYPPDKRKIIPVDNNHLQRIRIGQRPGQKLRVVFDFNRIHHYTKFHLTSPFRVVFDVYQREEAIRTAPVSKRAKDPPHPTPGSVSVIRQLGLGVKTIVLDPGHGGKDPGTVNPKLGLQEKQVTLTMARMVKNRLEKTGKFTIVLTRDTDRTVPLEERTAIANSRKGDLFISIHVNSSPRPSARGIESYFLSMTTDPWAMQVAAQENAASAKSIGEMKDIVEEIFRSAKVTESRILGEKLQHGLVTHLSRVYRDIRDLGVKKAPFFVLAGAIMPAVLVEISFMSHPEEGNRLKSARYLDTLADGLCRGIVNYIRDLEGT